MSTQQPTQQYVVVVPVKPPALGKSRLVGLSDVERRQLAEGFAVDTVAACLAAEAVAAVLVVTDDASFSRVLGDLGSVAIPDGVAGDLNGALRQGAAEARRRWPDLVPVAVCADLPALRAVDLDSVLGRVGTDRPRFVPDAEGVGTTMYVAAYQEFDPRFGPRSREAHLEAGAVELLDVPPSLRRDVDDLDDLRDAITLGLGPSSSARVPRELPRT